MIDVTIKGNMVLDFDEDLKRVISKEKAKYYDCDSENKEAKEEIYHVFKTFMITLYNEVLNQNKDYYPSYRYRKHDVMDNLIDIIGSKKYRGIYIDNSVLDSLIRRFNADKNHKYKYFRPEEWKTFRRNGRKRSDWVKGPYVLEGGCKK